MDSGLKAMVASQILQGYTRQGLNLNPHLVGLAVDAAELLEAELDKRAAAAAPAKAAVPPAPTRPDPTGPVADKGKGKGDGKTEAPPKP